MTLARALVPAVIVALRDDAEVTSLCGQRVHAEDVASAVYPYVAFGPLRGRAWNAGGGRGEEVFFALHCLARKGGRNEAMRVAAVCAAVLEASVPEIEGARVVGVFFQDVEVATLKDGETWRAVARFRALLEGQ